MSLTKEQILEAKDIDFESIDVPEWNGAVNVSVMSGFSRDKFESSLVGANGGTNMHNVRARLAVACVVDDNGKQMFTDKDIAHLGNKSGSALDRIYSAAQRINKMTDEDVDGLAKN